MSPRKALMACSKPGCWQLTPGGRCADCRREAEQQRGSASQRGYSGPGWDASRSAVLRRDPLCTCRDDGHDHDGHRCMKPSIVADHYPDERKDLLAAGVADPDAPHRMRGICTPCHNRKTAATSPGGWNTR